MKRITRLFSFFFIILLFPLLLQTKAWAGGGRTMFGYVKLGQVGHSEASFVAQVFKTSPSNVDYSANERVEFRIENPRSGDQCFARSDRTDELGVVGGYCTATQPGQFLVYLYSFDKGDESSRIVIYFDPAPTPTSTPIPPTNTPLPLNNSVNETSPTQPPSAIQSNSINRIVGFISIILLLVVLIFYFIVGKKLLKFSNRPKEESGTDEKLGEDTAGTKDLTDDSQKDNPVN